MGEGCFNCLKKRGEKRDKTKNKEGGEKLSLQNGMRGKKKTVKKQRGNIMALCWQLSVRKSAAA